VDFATIFSKLRLDFIKLTPQYNNSIKDFISLKVSLPGPDSFDFYYHENSVKFRVDLATIFSKLLLDFIKLTPQYNIIQYKRFYL